MDIVLYKERLKEVSKTGSYERYIKKNLPELHKYLLSSYPSDLSYTEKVYWFLNNIKEQPKCQCGKPLKFRNRYYGYNHFCSARCTGIYNIERVQQVKLERYGDAHYNNACKRAQTNFDKYGVANTFSSKELQKKIKLTNIERYGVDHPSKSQELMLKKQQNNLEKYGVPHSILSKEVREKIVKANQEYFLSRDPELLGWTEDGKQIIKCPHPECDKCQEKNYVITVDQKAARRHFGYELCTRLMPIRHSRAKDTFIEKFIKDILNEYNIEYKSNARDVTYPNEVDIYIPSKKIAIECNGVFWHSEQHSHQPTKHIDKYKKCLEKGIQLITIWEDQIINKPEIVKSLILSKLSIYKERIGARKCTIKEISSKDAASFLEANHIQGRTNAKVHLGLYRSDELVGVMTFSKRSKLSGSKVIDSNEWELSRFCTKCNIQVIGGADKLFKHFVRKYDPSKVTSFASNDISNGNLYKKLGFTQDEKITASYWYINKDTYIRYHRTSFTKTRLKALGYDIENKTEAKIMENLPYYKIWDSGHTKWNWTKK